MKKNEKENPLIKNKKNIKIKDYSDDQSEIKTFVIIIVVIVLLVGIIYGLTELFASKENNKETVKTGEISYDKLNVGMILNRPYDEYYVIAYEFDSPNAVKYSTIITKYMNNVENKKRIKIYSCDLTNKLNEEYYNVNNDNISNPKATKTEEFDFGELTLIKVKNGKVDKYVESYDEIKSLLK